MSRATFDAPLIPNLYDYGRATSATVTRGGGPERVVTDDPAPDFTPRPVGFTTAGDWLADAIGGTFPYDEPIPEPELPGEDPDLWEGDQA